MAGTLLTEATQNKAMLKEVKVLPQVLTGS